MVEAPAGMATSAPMALIFPFSTRITWFFATDPLAGSTTPPARMAITVWANPWVAATRTSNPTSLLTMIMTMHPPRNYQAFDRSPKPEARAAKSIAANARTHSIRLQDRPPRPRTNDQPAALNRVFVAQALLPVKGIDLLLSRSPHHRITGCSNYLQGASPSTSRK